MALVKNIEGLNGNKVVNQFIVTIGSDIYFQSYESIIARIDGNGKVCVSERWCYSNTTSKYFYKFLRDYTRFDVHRKNDVLKLIKEGKITDGLSYRNIA